jgi:hypothetical protein
MMSIISWVFCLFVCLAIWTSSFEKVMFSSVAHYSRLFSGAVGLVNLLPAFHPKPVLVSVVEMGLL